MKSKQLFFALVILLVLLISSLFGIAYGANSIMGKQATKLSKLRADSNALDTLQASVAKNKQDIAKYSTLNAIAKNIVPQDKDQAEAVREIVDLASQSGIAQLSSITLPRSQLGVSSTVPGTKTNPDLTQLIAVKGMPGVYQLQITVTEDKKYEIPYNQFLTFLSKLEQNRRTAQVSSITIQPDPQKPGLVAFTLVISEFIKP